MLLLILIYIVNNTWIGKEINFKSALQFSKFWSELTIYSEGFVFFGEKKKREREGEKEREKADVDTCFNTIE